MCVISKENWVVATQIFLFSSVFGEDSHFDEHIFQRGWNHQPEKTSRENPMVCNWYWFKFQQLFPPNTQNVFLTKAWKGEDPFLSCKIRRACKKHLWKDVTRPETNITSPLKMDGCFRWSFPFWVSPQFSEANLLLVSRGRESISLLSAEMSIESSSVDSRP